MALATQAINLDLRPHYNKQNTTIVYCSQYDNDLRNVVATITDAGEAVNVSTYTIYIEGTKPDKHGFSYELTSISGSVANNVVTFPLQLQMTACAGITNAEIVFFSGDERIGSSNFILAVEQAGLAEDIDISETDIPAYVDGAQQAAADAERAKLDAQSAKDTAVSAAETAENVLESIPADYSELSDSVDDLKSANSQLADHLGYNINQNYTGFQIGFYANGTGVYNPSRTDYVCTKSIIEVEPNSTVYLSDIPNGGEAFLITYDANRQYVNSGIIKDWISNNKVQLAIPADIYYVHIDIHSGFDPMNPADYADVIISTTQNTDVIAGLDARITDNTKRSTENKNVLSKISNYNQFGGWTVGLFSNADGAYYGNRTDYLCIADKMPVSEGDMVQLTVNAPTTLQNIFIQWYDSNDTLLSHSDYGNKREAIAFAPTDASYFHVSISKMYGEPMVMSDYMDTVLYIGISETDALSNILALRNNSDNLLLVNWTNYIYFFGQGNFGYADNRIGLLSTFKTKYKYT